MIRRGHSLRRVFSSLTGLSYWFRGNWAGIGNTGDIANGVDLDTEAEGVYDGIFKVTDVSTAGEVQILSEKLTLRCTDASWHRIKVQSTPLLSVFDGMAFYAKAIPTGLMYAHIGLANTTTIPETSFGSSIASSVNLRANGEIWDGETSAVIGTYAANDILEFAIILKDSEFYTFLNKNGTGWDFLQKISTSDTGVSMVVGPSLSSSYITVSEWDIKKGSYSSKITDIGGGDYSFSGF